MIIIYVEPGTSAWLLRSAGLRVDKVQAACELGLLLAQRRHLAHECSACRAFQVQFGPGARKVRS